jgi:hypothetical protein
MPASPAVQFATIFGMLVLVFLVWPMSSALVAYKAEINDTGPGEILDGYIAPWVIAVGLLLWVFHVRDWASIFADDPEGALERLALFLWKA